MILIQNKEQPLPIPLLKERESKPFPPKHLPIHKQSPRPAGTPSLKGRGRGKGHTPQSPTAPSPVWIGQVYQVANPPNNLVLSLKTERSTGEIEDKSDLYRTPETSAGI